MKIPSFLATVVLVVLFSGNLARAAKVEAVTLRSLGVQGDGVTDDRMALITALNKAAGAPVDGEGLTYAVNGNVEVVVDIDLRNATFVQTMLPVDTSKYILSVSSTNPPSNLPSPASMSGLVDGLPMFKADFDAIYPEDLQPQGDEVGVLRKMLNLRTLFFRGDNGRKTKIKLENIKVLRGDHPEMGGRGTAAGIYIVDADPVVMENVEVTGDGKGNGIAVLMSSNIKLARLNIHDMQWALYRGDRMPSLASLKTNFRWNNNPIYEYRDNIGRFVRYRVQEQLVGLSIGRCENIEVTNSRIAHIGTTIEGVFLPWQVDGMTVGGIKNFTVRDTTISEVWEGIDLTGSAGDGFYYENVKITDTFSFGFKVAHPKQNGKMVNCIAERAGLSGFIMGPEIENLVLLNCQSLETGSNGYWREGDRLLGGIIGIHIAADEKYPPPKNVKIENSVAINEKFPGMMRYGIALDAFAKAKECGITLVNSIGKGAKEVDISGL